MPPNEDAVWWLILCYCILILQRGFTVVFPYLHTLHFDEINPLYHSFCSLSPPSPVYSGVSLSILHTQTKCTSMLFTLHHPFSLTLLILPKQSHFYIHYICVHIYTHSYISHVHIYVCMYI
jgi:hypothetical protein